MKFAQLCNSSIVATKQQKIRMFQTVNHGNILWDPNLKPRGIFGDLECVGVTINLSPEMSFNVIVIVYCLLYLKHVMAKKCY